MDEKIPNERRVMEYCHSLMWINFDVLICFGQTIPRLTIMWIELSIEPKARAMEHTYVYTEGERN